MSKLYYLFTKHLRTMYAGEQSMIKSFQGLSANCYDPSLEKFYKLKAEEHLLVLTSLRKVFRILGVSSEGEVDQVIESILHSSDSNDLERNSIHQVIALCGRATSVYRIHGFKTAISSAEDLGAFDVAEALQECLLLVKFNRSDFEYLKKKFENAGIEATEFEAA